MQYLARDSRLRDPMEKEGGSQKFVDEARQSISDLEKKIVAIRCAIQQKNLEISLEIEGLENTIAFWLNWRRDIYPGLKTFLNGMSLKLASIRQQATRQGGVLKENAESAGAGDVVVSISESDLAAEIDKLESVVGQLDGKLSLLNATTLVEI